MRGHKTRRIADGINIPGAANIQACPVRRGQRAVHDVTPAVRRLFRLHHLMRAGVKQQRVRQSLPAGRRKNAALLSPAGCAGFSRSRVIFCSGTVARSALGSLISQRSPPRV